MKDRSDIKIGEINFHLCIEKQICPFFKKKKAQFQLLFCYCFSPKQDITQMNIKLNSLYIYFHQFPLPANFSQAISRQLHNLAHINLEAENSSNFDGSFYTQKFSCGVHTYRYYFLSFLQLFLGCCLSNADLMTLFPLTGKKMSMFSLSIPRKPSVRNSVLHNSQVK